MSYQLPASPAPVFKVSGIATGAEVVENGMELLQRTEFHHPTWFFIYLFVLLGFYAWIRIYYGDVFKQMLDASTNIQAANRMYLDNSLLKNQLDSVLYILYFLVIAFLIYFLEMRMGLFPYHLNGLLLYLFNLGVLLGTFLGKVVLYNLLGFLFNKLKIHREYLFNSFIFNKLMGLVVLTLLLFLIYTSGVIQEVFIWATLTIIILIFLMRIFRGIMFSIRKNILLFSIFLYLCGLEIAPFVLLYRWLEGIL